MKFRAMSLAVRLILLLLALALVAFLWPGGLRLGDFSTHFVLAAVSVPLVLVVAIAAYLARPSVRKVLSLFYSIWAGNYSEIRGNYGAAERHFLNAVAKAEGLRIGGDSWAGRALCQLGDVHRVQGRLDDAQAAIERALERFGRETPPHPCHRATGLANLAVVWIIRGRFADAEGRCREALDIFARELGPGHEFTATVLLNLARALSGQGRYEEAEETTRRALAMLDRQVRRGRLAGCVALINLADICRRRGRLPEAEPLARRAVALFEKDVNRRSHPTLANFLNVLAEIVRLQGRPAEAERLCRRSRDLTEKAFGPQHVTLDGCLSTLARIRAGHREYAEASRLLQRCLSIQEAAVVPEHPERITRMEEYAGVLRRMGRPAEADQWEARARAVPAWAIAAAAPPAPPTRQDPGQVRQG